MTEQMPANDRVAMVRGRIRESMRLSREVRSVNKPKVIAYYRYVFTDTKKYVSQVSVNRLRTLDVRANTLFNFVH